MNMHNTMDLTHITFVGVFALFLNDENKATAYNYRTK